MNISFLQIVFCNNVSLNNISEKPHISDKLENSSAGQFIDHVFFFNPSHQEYQFNLSLIKNERYGVKLAIKTPNVLIDIQTKLIGPDVDEDGQNDVFILAEGTLGSIEEGEDPISCSSSFGCALSSDEYKLIISGNTAQNVNLHIKITDDGISYSNDFLLRDVNAYDLSKSREYYHDLEDDKNYEIYIARTNSIVIENYAYVDVSVFDKDNHEFPILQHEPLFVVYGEKTEIFGTSLKGQYRIEINVDTNIDTVNLLFVLIKKDNIGDGPEENPQQESNPTETENEITFNVPYALYLGVGAIILGAVIVTMVTLSKTKTQVMR
ncbi:MAG: hypothetical protein GF364_03960 [Candidatus Lokiarchaeota archaeon]|nr:hypothetical protein [Candidatus Lokiarchaeota archaeon]